MSTVFRNVPGQGDCFVARGVLQCVCEVIAPVELETPVAPLETLNLKFKVFLYVI